MKAIDSSYHQDDYCVSIEYLQSQNLRQYKQNFLIIYHNTTTMPLVTTLSLVMFTPVNFLEFRSHVRNQVQNRELRLDM